MREERGDEVAEEGLPVGGGAVQVPVFGGAAGHWGLGCWWEGMGPSGLNGFGLSEVEEEDEGGCYRCWQKFDVQSLNSA